MVGCRTTQYSRSSRRYFRSSIWPRCGRPRLPQLQLRRASRWGEGFPLPDALADSTPSPRPLPLSCTRIKRRAALQGLEAAATAAAEAANEGEDGEDDAAESKLSKKKKKLLRRMKAGPPSVSVVPSPGVSKTCSHGG